MGPGSGQKAVMKDIFGFDCDRLNKHIDEKERIRYKRIRMHPLQIKEIRERQIGDIVDFFALYILGEGDAEELFNAYISDLGLPESRFREYYDSMMYIDRDAFSLSKNKAIPFDERGKFLADLFSLGLWHRIKDIDPARLPRDILEHQEKVKEISQKLIKARGLLNRDELAMIDASVEDVISEAVKDPLEIWRERDLRHEQDSHLYVSRTPAGDRKRLVACVSDRDSYGKIYRTLWRSSPLAPEQDRRRIYRDPKARK